MKNRFKKIFMITFALLIFNQTFILAESVTRYAIFIGSNIGGEGRSKLMYAGSDAKNMRSVLTEVGGIEDANSFLLINPNQAEIENTMTIISNRIKKNTNNGRCEFIFYYSGHSDEESILLGNQKYDYTNLKADISNVPSDVHVVILDSCYSGNFIRTKGGQKRLPFLMDDSSVVHGHAYLSSSSETETSQESDDIASSYFTSSLVTGLRGAADSSGDKKVSINELYSYAFNETLKRTEETMAGPQHPNFNITLVGSGDLILSDISESDSVVNIPKNIKGRISFRDGYGKLISEINKTDNVPVLIALPKGKYSILLIGDKGSFQCEINLTSNQTLTLSEEKFSKVKTKSNNLKGNEMDFANEKFSDLELADNKGRTSRIQITQENDLEFCYFINLTNFPGDKIPIKGNSFGGMLEFPACFDSISASVLYEFPGADKIHVAVGGNVGLRFADDFIKLGPQIKVIFPVFTTEKLLWNIETNFLASIFPAFEEFGWRFSTDLTTINKKNKGFYSGFGLFVSQVISYKNESWFKRYTGIDGLRAFMFETPIGFHFFMGAKL